MTRSLSGLVLSFALTAFAARADDEHQTVHVGAMLGLVSLPRPLDIGVFVKFVDLMSVGFSFSDFPNFVADPLLTAIGAKEGTTIARLDDFSAYEADLRLYPFRGAFFFGASLGHQSLKGAVIETTTGTSQTGTANVQTIYVTPRAGFLWTWQSGFLLGADLGVQFQLSSDISTTLPPGATPDQRKNLNNIVDAGSSYPLPSAHFRIGWQY